MNRAPGGIRNGSRCCSCYWCGNCTSSQYRGTSLSQPACYLGCVLQCGVFSPLLHHTTIRFLRFFSFSWANQLLYTVYCCSTIKATHNLQSKHDVKLTHFLALLIVKPYPVKTCFPHRACSGALRGRLRRDSLTSRAGPGSAFAQTAVHRPVHYSDSVHWLLTQSVYIVLAEASRAPPLWNIVPFSFYPRNLSYLVPVPVPNSNGYMP